MEGFGAKTPKKNFFQPVRQTIFIALRMRMTSPRANSSCSAKLIETTVPVKGEAISDARLGLALRRVRRGAAWHGFRLDKAYKSPSSAHQGRK